jgi:glyoxylase-like metal-dependent hydrolase (beta-lactamase superfamily II)
VVLSPPDTDHCGGNEAVRRRAPGVLFMAHRRDAPLVESAEKCLNQRYDFARPYGFPFPEGTRRRLHDDFGNGTPVDVGLRGGERLRIAPDRYVEILHLPGHTAGHLAVHDPGEDVLVACDAVLGRAMRTAESAPFSAPTYRHQEDYLRTIERIRELDPRLLLTSHLPSIQPRASVQAFLDESEAFVHELNEVLLDRLDGKRKALPLPQIAKRLDDFVANGRPLASERSERGDLPEWCCLGRGDCAPSTRSLRSQRFAFSQ